MVMAKSKTILEFDRLIEDHNKKIDYLFCERCANGTLDEIKYMIEKGANPRCNNDEPFMNVCSRSKELALYFINYCSIDLKLMDDEPLISATISGRLDIMELLLEGGMKVTSDVVACRVRNSRNYDIIILLLKYADPTLIADVYIKKYSHIECKIVDMLHGYNIDIKALSKECQICQIYR